MQPNQDWNRDGELLGTAEPPHTAADGPRHPMTIGDGLLAIGGLGVFAFSFAPFVAYDPRLVSRVSSPGFDGWYTAWSAQTFMAPLTWWVIAAGVILVPLAVSRRWWRPEREIAGLRPSHLQLGLSLFALMVLLGYALSDKTFAFGIADQTNPLSGLGLDINPAFAWGGVLMSLSAALATAGAIINHIGITVPLLPSGSRPS